MSELFRSFGYGSLCRYKGFIYYSYFYNGLEEVGLQP